MSLLAMISSSKDGIGEINTDLLDSCRVSVISRIGNISVGSDIGQSTYIDVSGRVAGAVHGLRR
jgi:hypothetical protein